MCEGLKAHIVSERDRYGLPITLMVCNQCGLIYSKEYFSENFLLDYYKSIYNQFKTGKTDNQLFLERTKLNSPSDQRYKYIKKILRKKFNDLEIIMEPGCNDGCNLSPFLNDGKSVYGCDFDEKKTKIGIEHGINILTGGIEKLIDTKKKADLIILSNVIAHVTDLKKFMDGVKKLLNTDGYIFIETPGFRGWWDHIRVLRQYRKNFLDFIQFEFCYIFDLSLLNTLLNNYNLKLYHGDESIRSIFKINENKSGHLNKSFNNSNKMAKSNADYLLSMEKKFLKFMFFKNKFYKILKRKKS